MSNDVPFLKGSGSAPAKGHNFLEKPEGPSRSVKGRNFVEDPGGPLEQKTADYDDYDKDSMPSGPRTPFHGADNLPSAPKEEAKPFKNLTGGK